MESVIHIDDAELVRASKLMSQFFGIWHWEMCRFYGLFHASEIEVHSDFDRVPLLGGYNWITDPSGRLFRRQWSGHYARRL